MRDGIQSSNQSHPGSRRGHAVARHCVLEARQPCRLGAPFREQSITLDHCSIMSRHFSCMPGVKRPDEPVQKTSATGCTVLEETIHPWGQPDRRGPTGDFRLIAWRHSIDAEDTPLAPAIRCCAGADIGVALYGR
jgi:hypothetical protein